MSTDTGDRAAAIVALTATLTAGLTEDERYSKRSSRMSSYIKAVRDLIAAILAEPHDYIPGDEFYSCSQAEDPDPAPGEGGPGSGCSDPDRAGRPCDCGRDSRVERLLRILAGAYDEGEQG